MELGEEALIAGNIRLILLVKIDKFLSAVMPKNYILRLL
jgi:hypothetical protein